MSVDRLESFSKLLPTRFGQRMGNTVAAGWPPLSHGHGILDTGRVSDTADEMTDPEDPALRAPHC